MSSCSRAAKIYISYGPTHTEQWISSISAEFHVLFRTSLMIRTLKQQKKSVLSKVLYIKRFYKGLLRSGADLNSIYQEFVLSGVLIIEGLNFLTQLKKPSSKFYQHWFFSRDHYWRIDKQEMHSFRDLSRIFRRASDISELSFGSKILLSSCCRNQH